MFHVMLSADSASVKPIQGLAVLDPKPNRTRKRDAVVMLQTAPLPPPKTSRGELTRQKILDAAERQIGQRGFAEASISTITAEAKVGQGTFYLYFRNKEDVLRELVLRMGRRLRRHLTLAISDAASRLEAERRGLLAFLEFARANPNLYRVVEESQFVDQAVFRR